MTAVVAISYFWSEWFSFFIYKSPQYFVPNFESFDLLIQEKIKMNFHDNG